MSDKVKSRLMIAGAAFCAALFLFSGAMLAREYLDQKQSAEAFDEVAGLVKEDVELPALELADDPAQEPEEVCGCVRQEQRFGGLDFYSRHPD